MADLFPTNKKKQPNNTVLDVEKKMIGTQKYTITEYNTPQRVQCVHCHQSYLNTHVITYYEYGTEKTLCRNCYKNLCRKANQTKQINKAVRILIRKENYKKRKQEAKPIHMVRSPLEKVVINGKDLSVIEWYVLDRSHYAELRDKKISGIRLSDDIVEFLRPYKKTLKKKAKTDNEAIQYLNVQWLKLAEKKKDKRDVAIESLLKDTANGNVHWSEETLSYVGFKRLYSATYQGFIYRLTVDGFQNAYGEQKYLLELTWSERDVIHQCPSKYNHLLFKSIQKSGVKKKAHTGKTDVAIPAHRTDKKPEKVIRSNDFIIRTNLFRCYHKEHTVEEVIGVVSIVYPNGKVTQKKVPCAFCETCGHYFMLDSEFRRLTESGIILAQIISGTDYYRTGTISEFNAASESILMRNGYNVKAQVGLTDEQRTIILQNILDNHIMTLHQIVSYLDMFIAQKKGMPQYQVAVNKWKKDRNMILNYNNDEKPEAVIEKIQVSGRAKR